MTRARHVLPVSVLGGLLAGVLVLGGQVSAVPSATSAERMVLATDGGSPDGGVGDVGLGLPGGVSSTPIGDSQWVVFESVASDLTEGDDVATSDVFATDGTEVVRLSVLPDGTPLDGSNSFDPSVCDSGRIVVFTTDADFVEADVNGAEDVYALDRDADGDTVLDEFSEPGSVTLDIVSATYDSEFEEYTVGFSASGEGVISGDCSTVAFVTDNELDPDDFNFLPDVYVRDLTDLHAPAERVSVPAAEGGEGGGYLPTIDADGSHVAFATEAIDLVEEDGQFGGVILRDRVAGAASYVTVQPDGAPSSALPDTENPPSISSDGMCVAFKADNAFDLLVGDTGPTTGVFVWDGSTSTPVVELVSIDEAGAAALDASTPRISDDCRFVGFQSTDEFIVGNDDNEATDVFVADRETDTVALVSEGPDDQSAAGESNIGQVLWDESTGTGQVLLTSAASDILGADGGSSEIDLFRVSFASLELPGKPATPTAVAGGAQATISWTAADDGGSTITGYTVTASPGGATCTWTTGPLTCTVTGLTNGTAYRFTVRAMNAIGPGPVSDQSAAVTPRAVPSAVTGVKATAGAGRVSLAWNAPANTGGAAITAYRVQRSTNGTTWTTVTSSAPLTRTLAVTGLTNGTTYRFRVAAINAAGVGANSSVVQSTPRTVASAPRSVKAKAGNKKVTLTWKAPTDNGGAAVTAYVVQRSTNGRTWTTVASPTKTTVTVGRLKNGTAYRFRVAAVNGAGTGANSSVVRATPRA